MQCGRLGGLRNASALACGALNNHIVNCDLIVLVHSRCQKVTVAKLKL
jgi:hypothetical protein